MGIETFKKLMSSLVESSMLYIRNRDLGVLSEFRGIGAGASYVLWGWNPAPRSATAMGSGRSARGVVGEGMLYSFFWLKVLSRNIYIYVIRAF